MTADPAGFRPKRHPAPEFPPRRVKLFARTPPVIFTALLGLCTIPPIMRQLLIAEELPTDAADLASGIILAIWLFSMLALIVKILRRPTVITEDLRVIPSRLGLFSATSSLVVVASIVQPFAPGAALALVWLGLALHLILAAVFFGLFLNRPGGERKLDPVWQMIFAGPFLVALFFAKTEYSAVSSILYITLIVPVLVVLVCGIFDLIRTKVAAPLRPMLVLHIGVLALLASLALELESDRQWMIFALAAALAVLLMLAAINWLTVSGFTPLWGAMSFPLLAVVDALARSGATVTAALLLVAVSLFTIWVCWRIFRLWPKGRLAAMTNAAEA